MIDYMTKTKTWGVVDPRSLVAREWADRFGTDAVELASPEVYQWGEHGFAKVKVEGLADAQLVRYSRAIAREIGGRWQDIYHDVIHGYGITIDAASVHITDDPDRGRAFWDALYHGEAC